MKKSLKIILFVFLSIIIFLLAIFLTLSAYLSNVKLDKNKLINLDRMVTFYDDNGEIFLEQSNGVKVTESQKIPEHTKKAFIAIEDKRFYSHKGVDYRALARATVNNVKSLSFKEGASTISQQLIKNTHLSGEKTLKRKLKEIKLTKELEKNYSKNEILEKYLNTIYFGDGCYGIAVASKYYFDKECSDLSVNESAVLAAIIKAPATYSPITSPEKCFERKNLVLKQMLEQEFINEQTYQENVCEKVSLCNFDKTTDDGCYDYSYFANRELNNLLEKYPYNRDKISVYTHYNQQMQKILSECFDDFSEISCEKSAILLDKDANVLAYYSSCGETYRQLGSIIKPIAVYAPAIENDVINAQTLILDEKTDFNGYFPSNFNDKYCGNISASDALANSSNVCAVKILNYLGIENAINTLNKVNIKTDEGDENLALALGATRYGATISQITSAYNVFLNRGTFISPSTIKNLDINNKTIEATRKKEKVFNVDTVSIINRMLNNVVKNGTAKKLSVYGENLYAKTGTVGNKDGNTDAYIISYDKNFTLGVWFGAENNSKALDNGVTGGTLPASFAKNFWDKFYCSIKIPNKIEEDGIEEVYLDKISYDDDGKIILADDEAPLRYKFSGYFKKNKIPKEQSTRFSFPSVEKPKTIVNNNEISVELCLIEYQNLRIYKKVNGKKSLVYDSIDGKKSFNDKLVPSTEYEYSYIPYFDNGRTVFYGEEKCLAKIKTPSDISLGDKWWLDDFE